MIRHSFIILDRIGARGEKNIWSQGIRSWDDFLNAEKIKGISKKSKHYYDRQLKRAMRELYSQNSGYFEDMPETWRLYRFFREDSVFLDIETTGVSRHDSITMVGLYNGIDTMTMIRGINLDMPSLRKELLRYKLVITFNGASFDLPFIRKRYSGLLPDIPHIDLMPLCRRIGLSGGLKEIEKQLGVKRNPLIEKLYGGDVLRLWRMYKASGDDYYLKLLVEYNEDDVISLRKIADFTIAKIEEDIKDEYFR